MHQYTAVIERCAATRQFLQRGAKAFGHFRAVRVPLQVAIHDGFFCGDDEAQLTALGPRIDVAG